MAENKIVGYKKIFGFVLPSWINEMMIREAVGGLLAAVVMLMVLIFFIWPNFATVKVKKETLSVSKAGLASLKSSSQGLERLQTDLSPDEQNRVLTAIPSEYSPDTAIYLLRKISADTGVSIISYSLPPGTILSGGPSMGGKSSQMVSFATYPIRITVAAPVNSLLTFIGKIESSIPFGVVSDLNLQEVTKLSRSAAENSVQLALEIRFYQAILGQININNIQTLTPQNIALAKELMGYNLLTVPESTNQASSEPVASGSGSVFGF